MALLDPPGLPRSLLDRVRLPHADTAQDRYRLREGRIRLRYLVDAPTADFEQLGDLRGPSFERERAGRGSRAGPDPPNPPAKPARRRRRRRGGTPVTTPRFARLLRHRGARRSHLPGAGLRRGELAGLRWEDLELGAGMLSVNRATVVADGHAIESEPKTARGRRRIVLDTQTVDALKRWRRQQSTEQLAMGAGWQGDGRVFVWGDGSALHPNVITRSFGRLVERAALPHLSLHGLRHSWATSALLAGVPIKVVLDRLGHSSSRITLDTYTASVPALDAQAAELVAGLFVSRDQSVTSGRD